MGGDLRETVDEKGGACSSLFSSGKMVLGKQTSELLGSEKDIGSIEAVGDPRAIKIEGFVQCFNQAAAETEDRVILFVTLGEIYRDLLLTFLHTCLVLHFN